ncbi:MAG: DUF5916 domain-containing protein [Bacteroidales bacterium]|nr:DUF5916 domain-containing protein [Bacteroidales bacterium]
MPAVLFLTFGWLPTVFAGEVRRELIAVRTSEPPVIDGSLQDAVWQKANAVSGFHQYEPHNDRPASFDTEVRVLYDDMAIYIAARMFDPAPDSILREMGLRNSGNNLNADRFYVDINPFNDGINGFRFQVSASGVQTDSNLSGGGSRGDINWDAVWISAHSITEDGWVVEMKIPYAALRFPKGEMQKWGINFWREIRRKRELSSWNRVDRRIGNGLAFLGEMNGIYGVRPPLRLAFYPYISNYVEKNGADLGWANTFNGGVDVKLGISPAFTMDMTLIPDFGQVQSDAMVLNLTPFEIKYDENRQFFTEGTELFGKADLFYSRRIGARPRNYSSAYQDAGENEVVKENPLETRLINATKISGRTASGLGVGFFNAMTAASEAVILDTLSQEKRTMTTQGFTNYNLMVLDQTLKNNSFISLINTNVTGAEKNYTANVTGTAFRFMDSSNMYRISGSGAVSQQYSEENEYGFKYDVSIGKFGGNWQYHYSRYVISDTYDQNDMGFLRRNNQVNDGLSLSYNIFDPFWRLWTLTNAFSFTYRRLYEPDVFTGLELQYTLRALFDTRFFINLTNTWLPRGERNYFEPRVPGRFYRTSDTYHMNLVWSTDYRRRLFFDGSVNYSRISAGKPQEERGFMLKPTFRASDRLNVSYSFRYNIKKNDLGYVTHWSPDGIFFGRRNSPTTINSITTGYIFSNKVSLNFNLRHYWSKVQYDGSYYLLGMDGRPVPVEDDLSISNINYNAFTIDMMLTWHFAPGSQMTIAWKNVIDNQHSTLFSGYFENLGDVLGQPQINSISVRLLYYLDYHTLRRINQQRLHS